MVARILEGYPSQANARGVLGKQPVGQVEVIQAGLRVAGREGDGGDLRMQPHKLWIEQECRLQPVRGGRGTPASQRAGGPGQGLFQRP